MPFSFLIFLMLALVDNGRVWDMLKIDLSLKARPPADFLLSAEKDQVVILPKK